MNFKSATTTSKSINQLTKSKSFQILIKTPKPSSLKTIKTLKKNLTTNFNCTSPTISTTTINNINNNSFGKLNYITIHII